MFLRCNPKLLPARSSPVSLCLPESKVQNSRMGRSVLKGQPPTARRHRLDFRLDPGRGLRFARAFAGPTSKGCRHQSSVVHSHAWPRIRQPPPRLAPFAHENDPVWQGNKLLRFPQWICFVDHHPDRRKHVLCSSKRCSFDQHPRGRKPLKERLRVAAPRKKPPPTTRTKATTGPPNSKTPPRCSPL